MRRRNAAPQRERILADSLPNRNDPTDGGPRDFTETERKLLHGYAKSQGILLFPEIDEAERNTRRRRHEDPNR